MTVYKSPDAGQLLELKNETAKPMDADFACVSAPEIVEVDVFVISRKGDKTHHDSVFVRESHSWWTRAGGKLLPASGLRPGESLLITTSGKAALRIDWD